MNTATAARHSADGPRGAPDKQVLTDDLLIYRGQLAFRGVLVGGTADLEFRLYRGETDTDALAPAVIADDWVIDSGSLLVGLDFGADAIPAAGAWLEITVDGVILSPRQFINPRGWSLRGDVADPVETRARQIETEVSPTNGENPLTTDAKGDDSPAGSDDRESTQGNDRPDSTVHGQGGNANDDSKSRDPLRRRANANDNDNDNNNDQNMMPGGGGFGGGLGGGGEENPLLFNVGDRFYSATDSLYLNIDADNNDADTRIFEIGKNRFNEVGGTTLFRLNENGNVGIGTTTPLTRFQVTDDFYVDSDLSFTGVNRSARHSNNEFFGIQTPTGANTYGGMYLRTDSATGWPFYGYANTGGQSMWTYYNGATDVWHVNNGGDRLSVTNAGNVGIGTTVPITRLDVAGTTRTTGFQLTTSPAAGRVLTSDASGVGTWQPAPPPGGSAGGDLTGSYPNPALATLATSLMKVSGDAVFTNGTNVGVGTTTPSTRFQVTDDFYVDSDLSFTGVNRSARLAGNEFFGIQTPTGDNFYGGMYIRTDSATGWPYYGYANTGGDRMWTYYNGATDVWHVFNGGQWLSVMSTGNVGIGISAPTTRLDVAGTTRTTGFQLTTGPAAGRVLTSDATGVGTWQAAAPLTLPFDGSADVSAPNAVFKVSNTGTGRGLWSETTSTSPGAAGIFGRATASSGFTYGGRFENDSVSGRAVFASATASTGQTIGVFGIAHSPDGWAGYFSGRGYFSGNVGIGTTEPPSPLSVMTTVQTPISISGTNTGGTWSSLINTSTGGKNWSFITTGSTNSEGPGHMLFRNNSDNRVVMTMLSGGNVGINTTSPGWLLHVNGDAAKPGGGSWTNASDARLKRNIADLDGALDRLLSLRGVTYEYIDPVAIHELPGERIGVIAQEVEAVFPDWVSERADGYKAVTFRGFEAVAVEAIRELRQEKDAQLARLTKENDELKSEAAAQRAMIESLAARLEAVEAAAER